ncbi:MAG: hypothetical protein U0936_24885 [Planctomycetaceae bacterium]
MDLSRLLKMLRHEREGQTGLRSTPLLHALKQMIGQGSRTRRNSSAKALDRPESLEARQVLSAISPVEYTAPLIAFEGTFVGDGSVEQGQVAVHQQDVFLPDDPVQLDLLPGGHVVQMVRDQLSKSLSPSNLIPEMSIPGETVQISGKASTSRAQVNDAVLSSSSVSNGIEVAAPDMIDAGLTDPIFSTAGEQLNLSFLIEYSDGPQEVTVETVSSTNLQIRVSGLADTIYESSGVEFTAQILYQNAIEVLQRVQPTRPVQILFPATSLASRERIPSVPGLSIPGQLDTDHGAELSSTVSAPRAGSDSLESLPDSLVQEAGLQATANSTSDDSTLIDQVFSVSELTLDTSILVRLGVIRLQQTLVWPQSDSGMAIRQQQEISAATAELKHETESVPNSITITGSQSGLAKLVRRGLSWLRLGRLPSTGLVSDAVASEFFARVAAELITDSDAEVISQKPSAENVEWLSWLLRNSSELDSPVGTSAGNGIHHQEPVPDAVPVFSNAVSSSRDMRGAWNTQAQIRKYREQHRHASGLNGAICIALYEHDSSSVPQSTSIPRELKYVANPRGPPVYGRDADVPLLEVDAPADLLERLRYSIAPRGPSLATVETQSPDLTFSSGPRMSPEKMSTELAI